MYPGGGGGSNLIYSVKNKQSNLIVSVKMLNIGVINKYTINLIGKKGGGLFDIS